jgi:glucoamylase
MTGNEDLAQWIAQQAEVSAARMERAISATGLTHARSGFGFVVSPIKGSILASPVSAHWDPEPDYFFHWLRDSAIAAKATLSLIRNGHPQQQARWHEHFEDFIRFSLSLSEIDGTDFLQNSTYRKRTKAELRKFLRPDDEVRNLCGTRILAEPRFNANGMPDFENWARPQYDGPALRALACIDYEAMCPEQDRGPIPELTRLIDQDLAFTLAHADQPCIGPWEVDGEIDHHYYTVLAQLGAIHHGRRRVIAMEGDADRAALFHNVEKVLREALEQHWSSKLGVYKALRSASDETATEVIDSCIILAVLDAELPTGRHSLEDERLHSTLRALEETFDHEFPVNRGRKPGFGPAMGRFKDDNYFGGGAWYPVMLGVASFYYRLAAYVGPSGMEYLGRGDAMMRTVRKYTPDDGSLSEQFDRVGGAQTSARHLTWSYAAFITAAHDREEAVERIPAVQPTA